jgi:ribosomal protein S18 acetylase RimI-like enzyme
MKDYEDTVQLWKIAGLEIRPGDEKVEIGKKLERDPELFLVAEDTDGSLVGTVLGSWDGRRGWIHHLAIRPDRQRSGLGTMIIQELEHRMRKKGVLKVNAIVYRTNQKSINFFKKHGYEHHEQDLFFGKSIIENRTITKRGKVIFSRSSE